MTSLNDMLNSHFAQRVPNPQLWIVTANGLVSAAECLAKDIETFWQALDRVNDGTPIPLSVMKGSEYQNTFLMLYGFAIENFSKAYAVTQLNTAERIVLRLGKYPGRLKSHRIKDLVAKELGYKLDLQEDELLMRLEAAVTWAGRYPVSTGPARSTETREKFLMMPQGIRGDDLPRTRELTGRIKERAEEMIKV